MALHSKNRQNPIVQSLFCSAYAFTAGRRANFALQKKKKIFYIIRLQVEGHAGDPSKVTAAGPGLQPDGNCINRPTYFDISTKGKTKISMMNKI